MVAPVPKTIYSSIMDEMFSNILKSKNEVKICVWKNKISTLKNVDFLHYQLLNIIMCAYENKNDEGLKIAEKLLTLLTDNVERAIVYKTIGNLFFHKGDFKEAIDSYWMAYELTLNPQYFDDFLSVATSFDFYDERLMVMKSLDTEKKIQVEHNIKLMQYEIEKMSDLNINIDLYRDILSVAYNIFYNHCNGSVIRSPRINDSSIYTVFFNEDLDLKTVGLLNDEMVEAQVQLLDKYEYEDLLNFPVIFTAENYSN